MDFLLKDVLDLLSKGGDLVSIYVYETDKTKVLPEVLVGTMSAPQALKYLDKTFLNRKVSKINSSSSKFIVKVTVDEDGGDIDGR